MSIMQVKQKPENNEDSEKILGLGRIPIINLAFQ
jgi:hypothetical protein